MIVVNKLAIPMTGVALIHRYAPKRTRTCETVAVFTFLFWLAHIRRGEEAGPLFGRFLSMTTGPTNHLLNSTASSLQFGNNLLRGAIQQIVGPEWRLCVLHLDWSGEG